MTLRRPLSLALPFALLATGGCLATRSDIERLELQVRGVQADAAARQARSDSLTRAVMREAVTALTEQFSRQFAVVSDSVRQVTSSLQRLQGDVQLAMYELKAQLTTVQEGLGQSQRRLQDLRTSVEAGAGAAPRPADSPAAAAAPGVPSAAELLKSGENQINRNAPGSARMNFQTLVDQYPTDSRASQAQRRIADTYMAEGNKAAADSVWALVAQKYPNSDDAPTAIYKRAMLASDLKDSTRAKTLFSQIVARYPKSPERYLADEYLNPPKKP